MPRTVHIIQPDLNPANGGGLKQNAFSLTPVFLFIYKVSHLVHLTSIIRIKSIMVKSKEILKGFLFALLMLSFQSGCATHGHSHSEDGKNPALLMKEAADDFDQGRYESAIRKLEKIVTGFPCTEMAEQAMVKMAEAYYESEDYDLAFFIYRMYEERHPNYSVLPYVMFRQGMCRYNELKGFENQSLILGARGEFDRLIQNFPGSEFASEAREKLSRCDELLARYELHVGHFYYNRKKYRAAIGRYEYVMRNYPDLEPCQEAFEYARKAREILNLPEEQDIFEQRPPMKETAAASRKMKKKKPRRSQRSPAPALRPTRPAPLNAKKSKVPVSGKNLHAVPPEPEVPVFGKSSQSTLSKMSFSVQVGAFLVKKNAERRVAVLAQKKYHPFILELPGNHHSRWYSVRILNCSDLKEAFRAASEFREREGSPAIVTAVDSLNPIPPRR